MRHEMSAEFLDCKQQPLQVPQDVVKLASLTTLLVGSSQGYKAEITSYIRLESLSLRLIGEPSCRNFMKMNKIHVCNVKYL